MVSSQRLIFLSGFGVALAMRPASMLQAVLGEALNIEMMNSTGVQEVHKAATRLSLQSNPDESLMETLRSMSDLQFNPDPLEGAELLPPPHSANTFVKRQAWAWDRLDCITLIAASSIAVIFNAAFARRNTADMRDNLLSLAIMLTLSGLYILSVHTFRGQADAEAWFAGYVLESALSVDDLFVFHVIFTAFAVPSEQAHSALTAGIYAGIFLRAVFIVFFSALFKLSYAMNVAVGCILILGACLTLMGNGGGAEDVQNLYAVRLFKWLLGPRLKDQYDEKGYAFTYGKHGLQCNVRFLVVCTLIVVDIFSALDAIGSKTKEVNDTYLNMSSSFMTMFTLRPLFFVIRGMASTFGMVKYGISAILVFVGVQMIIMKWYPVPLSWLAIVIMAIFSASVFLSIVNCWMHGDCGQNPSNSSQSCSKRQKSLSNDTREPVPEGARHAASKDDSSPI